MEWTQNRWGRQDYNWADPMFGDFGFSHHMFPEGSFLDDQMVSDYAGPFGVLSFDGGEGTYRDCGVPWRTTIRDRIQPAVGQGDFSAEAYREGGLGRWRNNDWGSEVSGQQFGSIDPSDMFYAPYYLQDYDHYGRYGYPGYDGWDPYQQNPSWW